MCLLRQGVWLPSHLPRGAYRSAALEKQAKDMAKRAPSAYFLFCEEERASARQACTSADASGKVSVAIVAKELGKRWEALPAERRQTYKDRAQQRALEAQTAQKEPSQSK